MTLQETTQTLRRQLRQWAAAPEWTLLIRYELLPQRPSPVWHKRLSQKAGRLLRVMGLSRARYCSQLWQPGLNHAETFPECTPLLIWSDSTTAQAQREACAGLQHLLLPYPHLCPVLATAVADFRFYSRLGWLVEYLPDLPGEGPSYLERKRRYLAWRYRHALAIPLSAGQASTPEFTALLTSEY